MRPAVYLPPPPRVIYYPRSAAWTALRIAGKLALACAAFGALAFALVVVCAVTS
jgi:hypothetical protein